MIRNLLFFLCPFSSNDEWKRNVEELAHYASVFNGTKVVCIVTGSGLAEYRNVRRYIARAIGNEGITWIDRKNDADICEGVGFLPMMNEIRNTKKDEITFYCHAKGVTPGKTREELRAVRIWRALMYRECLNDIVRIEKILSQWACCGCLKKYGTHHLSTKAPWHFSGTYFWFRNDVVFGNEWWDTKVNDRYWVEGYLSQLIDSSEAYCLYGDDPWPCNLYKYSEDDWARLKRRTCLEDWSATKTASDALEYSYKRDIVQLWRKEKDEAAKALLLRKEGVRTDEFERWCEEFGKPT